MYLGIYNAPESRAEYGRVVSELAAGATPERVAGRPVEPTVDQVLLAFWKHAEQHYRRADGTPTQEIAAYRQTFKVVCETYGTVPASTFGPVALKTVREKMIALDWCRRLINQRVGRIRRAFKWAASEQLVPVAVYQSLATVTGLQLGRTGARETEPVGPVAEEHVRAALPFLRPQVRGMVELQHLTGMRPGEVCAIRPADIDRSGSMWVYRPPAHKMKYQGRGRAIALGPRAQTILANFAPANPTECYFSPARSVTQLRAERAAARKTPRYGKGCSARKSEPARRPAGQYSAPAYCRAIARAIEAANARLVEAAIETELHVPHWHPNQLRHSHATEVRKRYGLEAAQVVLGHAKADVTQVYAEKNLTLALRVAAEMG